MNFAKEYPHMHTFQNTIVVMSFDFYGPASSQAQEGLLVSFRDDPTVQDGMVVTASASWFGQVILKSNSVHIR
jgi:hypothetical protein